MKLPDDKLYQKKQILFDYSMMPLSYGGTSEYQVYVYEAFHRLYEEKYDIFLYTSYKADKYHKLSEKYDNILYPDTITDIISKFGAFHLGFSANQLMFYDQLVSINKYCLKIIQIMHDIMMVRINNHFPFSVHKNVELGIKLSDAIIFDSNYSKNDFLAYYSNLNIIKDKQLEVVYITTGFIPPVKTDYEILYNDYYLIVGNEYKHKAVKEAIESVSDIDKNFIIIGYGDNKHISKHIYNYGCGHLDEDFLSFLYANCKAVIIPSLYEGFGLPITIGLKNKKRVIVYDNELNRELQNHFSEYKNNFLFFDRFEEIGGIVNKIDTLPALVTTEYNDSWDRVAIELEAIFKNVLSADVDIEKLKERMLYMNIIEEGK